MNCVALDDEKPALVVIETFAKKNDLIKNIHTFQHGEKAKAHLLKESIDLLFLDIHMPVKNGFSFYNELPVKPMLVFTTSHSEYAVKSYDFNAIDYLLKPFTKERFNKAVEKAFEAMKSRGENPTPEHQQLTVRMNYGLKKIAWKEIVFIQSWDNYIKIRLTNGKDEVIRKTLKEVQKELPDNQFIKVHRSFLVNIEKVSAHRNNSLFLLNNIEVPVSNSYKKSLIEIFG